MNSARDTNGVRKMSENNNGKSIVTLNVAILLSVAGLVVGLVIGVLGDVTMTTNRFVSKEQYRVDQERTDKTLDRLDRNVQWLVQQEARRGNHASPGQVPTP
jgi:hypothetical protein